MKTNENNRNIENISSTEGGSGDYSSDGGGGDTHGTSTDDYLKFSSYHQLMSAIEKMEIDSIRGIYTERLLGNRDYLVVTILVVSV